MRNIIFIAPPAAGKGTQSDLLVKKYGYAHISTGDLLRNEVSSGTELGKKLDDILKYVNVDVMNYIVEDKKYYARDINELVKTFIKEAIGEMVKIKISTSSELMKKDDKASISLKKVISVSIALLLFMGISVMAVNSKVNNVKIT